MKQSEHDIQGSRGTTTHSWGRRHTGYLWPFLCKPGCTSLTAITLMAPGSFPDQGKNQSEFYSLGKEDSEHRPTKPSPEPLPGPAWLTGDRAPAASYDQDLGLDQAFLSGIAPLTRTLFLMQIPFCDLVVPKCISRDLP